MSKLVIIGGGTYGTYLAKRLLETQGHQHEITLIEIGGDATVTEQEIGLQSETNRGRAATEGRYFGLGGTSARWGGHIIFFDEKDNPQRDPDWQHIVRINKKYRVQVLQNLIGSARLNGHIDDDEKPVKTGVWLKYSKRNLYKALSPQQKQAVQIVKNQRVIDFEVENGRIKSVICQDSAIRNTQYEIRNTQYEGDVFYLTAGAIESCRLLLQTREHHGLSLGSDLGKNYSDHISTEMFRIRHYPTLLGKDLLPRFYQGNLVTKRLVVTTETGMVGFMLPIFNKDVAVFSSIKKMLFGKQKIAFNFMDILRGVEFLFKMAFHVFILKKMYVHRGVWSLQLDMEQAFPNNNTVSLSDKMDTFGQKIVQLNWHISETDRRAFADIKHQISQQLTAARIPFEPVFDENLGDSKMEDVYHPVGFMRMGADAKAVVDYDCRVQGLDNLFHFSTAIFPTAKSINPTAAGFCFIEAHLEEFRHRVARSSHREPQSFF
jgi:choline dehydrogenase-like flavoprotein